MMSFGQKLLAVFALLAGMSLNPAQAQTRPKLTAPTDAKLESFMYVGNSFFYYNNGLPGYVGRLTAGAPAAERKPHRSTMITMGGSGFDWHDMESYFRPNAVGYYNFDANNNIIFNTRAKVYDAVVMMDCSQCPIHPQLSRVFTDYAGRNSEIARKHGAEPILFMSWAYADKPEMTEQLAEAYTIAGNANNALVIPAGLAFARVVKERPDLVLYQPDKRHPTLIGTYLAAATVYAALTGHSPEVNSYNADLDPALARYLRAAAWATTQAYYTPAVR
jgi:hypothetical protein